MTRDKGSLGIGARVSVPGRGLGTVLSRVGASEYMLGLDEDRVVSEMERLSATYGNEWRRRFVRYGVEFEAGGYAFVESLELEVLDAAICKCADEGLT